MRFTLSFKTPDVTDQLDEECLDEAKKVLDKFLEWGEYITVEFDTETNSAKVLG